MSCPHVELSYLMLASERMRPQCGQKSGHILRFHLTSLACKVLDASTLRKAVLKNHSCRVP